MSTAVVVPSNRKITSEFLRDIPKHCLIYIVNDSIEDIPIDNPDNRDIIRIRYEDHQKIIPDETLLKDFMTIRSAGCRNIGILQAYRDGADLIINLDDDLIVGENTISGYEEILLNSNCVKAEHVKSNKKWFNTLGESEWFARGVPYEERIGYQWQPGASWDHFSIVHMGLWEGVVDLNGIDKLILDAKKPPEQTPFNDGVYYTTNQYIPLCAMNCGAVREAAMALLQVPMGYQFYSRYRLFRIEDIWGGYIWQSLFPNTVTFGGPSVKHYKQGNLSWEIISENYANILSHEFEEAVDWAAGEARKQIASLTSQVERYRSEEH